MSAELDLAIAELEREVSAFTSAAQRPQPGSADWYTMQAKAAGLSLLRHVDRNGGDIDTLRRRAKSLLSDAA